ncbi:DEAD/DEAH box helicase [Halobaculum sp. MBLA0147]|uniref:DEAD/DEAH box helicase n=1 Tax=Halobaculum sp. MBLA0147 TaxID=3079934 RepID=UPI003524E876
MHVRDLPLGDEYVAHFREQGIEELYPPQAAAVDAGVCDGANLVAAVPTASGKTFVAELALLSADGPGLYVCPLRALAREKYEEFAELPGVSAGIATGDYDSAAAELADHDVVVATSEKVDSAIRNGAAWIADLACVVVDEVHLVGSEGRGPTLEVTLATLRRRTADPQVVALSATVANPAAVAGWLDAELVESDWRPIDLRTGVYADGAVAFDDGTERSVPVGGPGERGGDATGPEPGGGARTGGDPDRPADDTEATAALVGAAVGEGGQAIAFVRSRREAEELAQRLSEERYANEAGIGMEAAAVAEELRQAGTTEQGERLAECAAWGVAFHHAGVRSDHRSVIERAFRDRELAVLCATPTLAAGVNVPARQVVVRDQRRYTGSGMEWLPTLEVHQMAGRAGRPGLDPYGEAVLVGDPDTETELWERYVDAGPEAVESQLRDRAALRTHALAVVAAGFADSQAEILDLLGETFYAHRTPNPDLGGVVGDVIAELIELDMLAPAPESGAELTATALGEQVSRQYVTPQTGARMVDGLRTVAGMADEDVGPLTVLEILCDTPDMDDTYLGNDERATLYQFARRHAASFTTDMTETDDFEAWLESVKTARVLLAWIEGADAEEIVAEYRIGPGDLESRIERATWLVGALDALADVVGVSTPAIAEVRGRL